MTKPNLQGPRASKTTRAIDRTKIKQLRARELRWSQIRLAEVAGVSPSTVGRAETGRDIRMDAAEAIQGAIAKGLGRQVEALFYRTMEAALRSAGTGSDAQPNGREVGEYIQQGTAARDTDPSQTDPSGSTAAHIGPSPLAPRSEAKRRGPTPLLPGREPASNLKFTLNPEICEVLSRRRLALRIIDGYVELEMDERGWERSDVEICDIGSYHPPAEFDKLLRRFQAQAPIRGYYSLQDIESRTRDEAKKLILYFQKGDWRHIYTMNEIDKNLATDAKCQRFRKQCELDFVPGRESWLYRQVCCQVLVVSADNQIILGRRRTKTRSGHAVPFFPGAWTATLEENMLASDPTGETVPDSDLFACAERGVCEELNATPVSGATRLVGYGIEWGSFAAAFLFIVRTVEDFRAIAAGWAGASDKVEAVALDCIPISERKIVDVLSLAQWTPSENAVTWKGADSIAAAPWHHSAKARLFAALKHLKYLHLLSA